MNFSLLINNKIIIAFSLLSISNGFFVDKSTIINLHLIFYIVDFVADFYWP